MINKLSILSIAVFSFFLISCEGKDNSSSQDQLGSLLLLTQSSALRRSTQSGTPCPPEELPAGVWIADEVVSAPGNDPNREFGDASKATNGICGAGVGSGSLNIYELESEGSGAEIVLRWKGKKVENQEGVDFTVFENGFRFSASSNTYFVEPIVVEVSRDNAIFCGFTPGFRPGNDQSATAIRDDWESFAGLSPVLYNMTSNPIPSLELFDDANKQANGSTHYMGKTGGDGFDLDDLKIDTDCTSSVRQEIWDNGFIYLRLTASQARGFPAPSGVFRGAADIEGVIARSVSSSEE